jgi:hypothetical protein
VPSLEETDDERKGRLTLLRPSDVDLSGRAWNSLVASWPRSDTGRKNS